MPSVTRLLGLICAYAACNLTFPPPISNPIISPENAPLVVKTTSGRVQGYYMSSLDGKLIGSFEGIPYAEPPIGRRRFQNPDRKRPWNGILDAGKPSPVCIQMDPTKFYRVLGEEDCLYLNIYTPLNRSSKYNIPVIVWIHGGGYYWGAGSYSGPTYLLDQEVILVTLNYRLGALGFLSTGDSASPGNYGLKDQSMAIAWIQENIVFFGGDPKRITLIGQSAGAASVHLHLMSPQTKDKLYGAISQSGSALSHWALPPRQLYYFKKLAGSVNCYASTSEGIMNCLRRRTARELIYRQFNLFEWVENPQILFGPVVEPESDSAFITMTPQAYYEKGLVAQIPWITGVTKDEGDLFSLVNYLGPLSTRSLLRNMDTVLPSVLMYNSSENESTNKIRTFYLQEYPKFSFSGFETLKSLSRMVGDRFFYVPFHKTVRIHSNSVRAPLYAYMFSYKGRHGTPEKFQLSPAEWGVMHLDELQYLFNSTELFAPMLKSDKEYPVAKHFIDLWTNFAKTGMPVNPQYANSPSGGSAWKKYSSDSKVFYEINERSKMIQEPDENRVNFWKSINHY